MKFTTLRAFQKHIEGAERSGFSRLYLISSSEGGEGRMALDCLVEGIRRKEGVDPLGIRTLLNASVGSLSQEIDTVNFFSPKRILIATGAETLSKQEEALVLKPLPPGLFLILLAEGKSTAFFKKVEKEGIVVELGSEKSWEKERNAQEWIMQRFREEKREIESAAIPLLAKEAGGEMALLEQEIIKLITYTEGKKVITRNDVVAVSISRPALSVFLLSEALFKKQIPTAIKLFRDLLEEGNAYFAILKQLRGQVLIDLEIASILRAGGNVAEITQSYPYIKGFILEKHLETVRTWGFDGLKRALIYLDDFEIRAKEGSANYPLLADLFVIKLC